MHVSRTCLLAGCFGGQKTPMGGGGGVVVGVGSFSDSEQPACCFLLRFDSRNCSNKAVAAQPAVAFTSTWSPQTGCCWPGNDRLSPRWLNSPWARRTSRQKKGECASLCLYGRLFLAPQIKFLFKFGCRRFWSLKYLFLETRSSSGLYFRVTTWQPRNVSPRPKMKPEIDKVDRSNSDFWVLSKIGAQKVSVWFLKSRPCEIRPSLNVNNSDVLCLSLKAFIFLKCNVKDGRWQKYELLDEISLLCH